MPKGNPNPRLENLTNAGKGRKPTGNETLVLRVSGHGREALEALAAQYGCLHGDKPSISGLLARVAEGELLIVPAPPTRSTDG